MGKTEIASLIVTAALIVMDYVTGLLKACMQHDISSAKMREGLYHKGAYVLVVALAEIIDTAQTYINLGFSLPLVVMSCAYIVLTEMASVIENLGEINPELQGSRLLGLFRSDRESEADE